MEQVQQAVVYEMEILSLQCIGFTFYRRTIPLIHIHAHSYSAIILLLFALIDFVLGVAVGRVLFIKFLIRIVECYPFLIG